MKKTTKYLILFLTLLLPLLIYLFLEVFGENKYVIPVFYQDEKEQLDIAGCPGLSAPHSANLAVYGVQVGNTRGAPMVVNPVFDECLDCAPNLNQIKRVDQRHDGIVILNIYSDMITRVENPETAKGGNWLNTGTGFPDLIKIVKCELLVEVPFDTSIDWLRANAQLVLLDKDYRIRGYYKKGDPDEVDRLITEIDILKQE